MITKIYKLSILLCVASMFFTKYLDFSDILQQMRKDFKSNSLSDIQKQMFQTGTMEYLYDYKKDPWQYHNLAKDPKYAAIIAEMRKSLKDSIIKNRDVMFLPEFELNEISKTKTPYEFRLNDENYPISQIYKAASLSGIKTETALKEQLSLLKSDNKFVRYWAAIGLKSQGKNLLDHKKEILANMDESYQPVKILLASVCYDNFLDCKAKAILLRSLTNGEDEKLSLPILQMLIYQRHNIEFIPAVKQLLNQKETKPELREVSELFVYVTKGLPLKYNHFW